MANTLKLKRSAVASKVPLTTDLQLGELAVNTYDGKLYMKKNDGTDSIVLLGPTSGSGVTISDTAPSSPSAGSLWWRSTEGQLYVYYNDGNTSQWVVANAFVGGSAYLPLTGGTLTGALTGTSATFSGNVGIGTTSPSELLSIQSDGRLFFSLTRASNNATQSVIQGYKARGTNAAKTVVASGDLITSFIGAGYDGTNFIDAANITYAVDGTPGTNNMPGRIVFATNGGSNAVTERMRIDSSGNVGIGITATSYAGGANNKTFQMHNSASTITDIRLTNTTTGTGSTIGGLVQQAGNDFYLWNASNGFVVFGNNALERMRIDTNGYLLVGYTTSNGAYRLQVNSQIFATSATIATSDGRYKENVVPLTGALDLVNALNPVQFSWKEHPVHNFDRAQPTVGFIAQEVQQVLADAPYLNSIVKRNECTIEPEERDEDGNVIKEAVIEDFYGIAEGNMIAILTKAIQELTARVEALEAK